MEKAQLPTQAEIKQALYYDQITGVFRWRVLPSNRVKLWSVAGGKSGDYILIGIKKGRYGAHRLAWLYMTGEWPENQIDHIDGNGLNNSFGNLRKATIKQNQENLALKKNNTSGFRGVSWIKNRKKWRAGIEHNGKSIYLGYFDTAQEAAEVASAKRAELFTHDSGRDFYCKPCK